METRISCLSEQSPEPEDWKYAHRKILAFLSRLSTIDGGDKAVNARGRG